MRVVGGGHARHGHSWTSVIDKEESMKVHISMGRDRFARRWLGLALVPVATVGAAIALTGTTSATAAATVAAGSQCGVNVPVMPTSAAFKSLPASAQKEYTYFPYPVTTTPWAAFKGKKPPWKIGYISEPLFGSGGWLVHILAEVKAL